MRRFFGVLLALVGAGLLAGLFYALNVVRFDPHEYQGDPVGFGVTVVAAALGWAVAAGCALLGGVYLLSSSGRRR